MKQKLHRIRGRSLEKALEQVKIRFGPDALIQDTREVEVRRENSLGMEKVFEISVLDEGGFREPKALYTPQDRAARPAAEAGVDEIGLISWLRTQIMKVQELNGEYRRLREILEKGISGRDDYPIYGLLIRKGVFVEVVNMIMLEYFNQEGQRSKGSVESAVSHIQRNLRTVDCSSWDEIGGTHIFAGAAGSGKSTIVMKLAGRLAERGRPSRIISLFPRNLRDLGGYEIFDDEPAVEVVIARTIEELDKLLQAWKGKTVLVDTPCILSSGKMNGGRFADFIKGLETAHVHYLFDVSAGQSRIRRELEAFDRICGDFAVLTKYDLVAGEGSFLNLISEKQLAFSLINSSALFETGLEIATDDILISYIAPDFNRGESPSEESFLLNYGTGPDDTDKERSITVQAGAAADDAEEKELAR